MDIFKSYCITVLHYRSRIAPSLLRHTENIIAAYTKRAHGNTQCFHIAQRLLLYLSFELWQPTIGMERLVAELP